MLWFAIYFEWIFDKFEKNVEIWWLLMSHSCLFLDFRQIIFWKGVLLFSVSWKFGLIFFVPFETRYHFWDCWHFTSFITDNEEEFQFEFCKFKYYSLLFYIIMASLSLKSLLSYLKCYLTCASGNCWRGDLVFRVRDWQ